MLSRREIVDNQALRGAYADRQNQCEHDLAKCVLHNILTSPRILIRNPFERPDQLRLELTKNFLARATVSLCLVCSCCERTFEDCLLFLVSQSHASVWARMTVDHSRHSLASFLSITRVRIEVHRLVAIVSLFTTSSPTFATFQAHWEELKSCLNTLSLL